MEDLWDTVPQIGNARQNLCIKVYVRQKDELLAKEEEQAKLHTQDDCYPFIFTNIKGPILVKEEDMDAYIRSHEDDFIGQAEESLPRKSCQRLFELFDIDTDRLEL